MNGRKSQSGTARESFLVTPLRAESTRPPVAADRGPDGTDVSDQTTKPQKHHTRTRIVPYILIAPATVYVTVFQLIPFLHQVYLSFTDAQLTSPADAVWIGFRNYSSIFSDPNFQRTLLTTLIYVAVCVLFPVGIGLATALYLNVPFRGRLIARALIALPYAAPGVAIALVFAWMLNPQYGILTRALSFLGINPAAGVLQSTAFALPAILLITVWQLTPFNVIVMLSALQSIRQELVEATRLDGGGSRWIFTDVTWPTIKPTIFLLLTLNAIWSLRRFELIWVLTKGGPADRTKTLVIDLYSNAFELHHLGRAAAMGVVGVVVSIVFIGVSVSLRAGKSE